MYQKENRNEEITKIVNLLDRINVDSICLKLVNELNKNFILTYGKIEKLNHPLRHCQIVDNVRKNKNRIYTSVEDQLCKGGASALGFCELPDNIKNGTFYYKDLDHFQNLKIAKKTIDSISFLKPNSTKYVIYSTLENLNYNPDIVLFFVTPKQAMILTQAYLYDIGGSLKCEFSGNQSFCSDVVSRVLLLDTPNITIGCSGSRKYTNIKDEELIFSIPWSKLSSIYLGLKNIIK